MSVFRENTQRTEQKEITEQKETFAKEPAKIPYRCKHPALNSTNNSTTVDSKTDIDVGLVYADHTVDSFVSAEYPFEEITESMKNYKKMFKNEYVMTWGMGNFLENVAHNDLMKYFQTIPNHGGGSSFYYAIVNFIDSTTSLRNTFWKNTEYLKLLAENLKLLEKKQLPKKLQQLRKAYPSHHGTIINTLEFFKMHWIRHLVYDEVKRDRRTTEKVKEMLLKGVRYTLSNLFSNSTKEWSMGKVGKECRTIDGMEILAAARIIQHDIIIRFSRVVSRKKRVGFRYFEIKPDNMQLRSACILKVNNGQYANLVAIKEGNGPTKKESFETQQNESTPEIFITQNSSLIEDLLMHQQSLSEHIHRSNPDEEYWSNKSLASRGYTSRGEHRTDHNRSNGDHKHSNNMSQMSSTHHRPRPNRVAPVATVPTVHTRSHGSHGSPSRSHTRSHGSTRSTRSRSHHSPGAETFNIGDIVKYKGEVFLQDDQDDNNVGMVINVEHYNRKKYNVTAVLNGTSTTFGDSSTFEMVANKGSASTPISLFKQWLDNKVDWSTVTSSELVSWACQWRTELYSRSPSRSPTRSLTMSRTMSRTMSPSRSLTRSRTRSTSHNMTTPRFHRSSTRSCNRRKHSKKPRKDYMELLDKVKQRYKRYMLQNRSQYKSQWIETLPPNLEKGLFEYVQSQEKELKALGFYHQNFTTPNPETRETLRRLFPEWPLEPYLILQVLNSIRHHVIRPTHNSESEVDIEYLKKEIMLSIGTKGACCFLKGLNNKLKRQLANFMKNIITLNMAFHNPWLFDLANINSITTKLDLDVGIGLVLLNWGYSQVDFQSIQNQRKQTFKRK